MTSTKWNKILPSVPLNEIPKVKKEIISELPHLNAKDIRRYKIPYNEAVLHELREEGSYEAAEYFKCLLNIDEERRISAGRNTSIWNEPKLKDNKELIDYLLNFLTNFFQHTISDSKKATALIKTALVTETLSSEWWWITDVLYRTAFWIVKEIRDSDEQLRMISLLRFVYGRFLFHKMNNARAALEHVRKAQRSSREKPWSISMVLDVKHEMLFMQCCTLMHKVLLSIAREVCNNQPQVAVNSCKVALTAAIESGQEELVAEAQFELGKSQIAIKNVKQALKCLYKSLAIMEKIFDPIGMCEAYSQLANVYKEMNEDKKVLEHLQKLKDTATNYQLPNKLAEAHYLAGEYYLYRGNPTEASLNFESAFSLYNGLGAKETNLVRCLTGVSRGQELLHAFQALLVQCIGGNVDATLQILNWKDRGEPFEEKPMPDKSTLFIRMGNQIFSPN
ncbi:PREDICTED: uncharacterized protein LOC105365518 [Ceratosolen solmsi marchali]|uniref:Tetratricopeptide repeat protein 29 n=1 Tax=Ceratosolen solmsi marchali TaxID=326594 RepID=A0AAJ6YPW5_9HYME|nr:PREDICTED: uncharacterized protein LOC105365518 [Ceratosolen solmsi marchali]